MSNPLPRQALHEQWANTALTLPITLPLHVVILYFLPPIFFQTDMRLLPALLGGSLFSLCITAIGLYISTLQHRHCRWQLSRESLSFCIGVWWRREHYIARTRVQYIDVQQGPLERRFGISRLIIHTAGTMNAIVLKGLLYEDAQRIREELINDTLATEPA